MCHAEGSTQVAGGAAALAISPVAGVQGDFASAPIGKHDEHYYGRTAWGR